MLLTLFAVLAVNCTAVRLTDSELDSLDPDGVLKLYWQASLEGDSDTITRLAGASGKEMIWECPPIDTDSAVKGVVDSTPLPASPKAGQYADRPNDNVDFIFTWARVIQINHKPLGGFYHIAERKVFRNEARISIRPKETPNPDNSMVLFMLHDGARWRLIDVRSEAHLGMVGNKKFAEPRDCPTTR